MNAHLSARCPSVATLALLALLPTWTGCSADDASSAAAPADASGDAVAADGAAGDTGSDGSSEDVATDTAPPNHAPLATADEAELTGGSQLLLTVLYNDGDWDGDKLTISAVSKPERGTVDIIYGGTVLRYSANDPTWVGKDTFTYTVQDGHGATSTATVTIVYKTVPTLKVLTPAPGASATGGALAVTFSVTGCNFTSPSKDKNGCHAHKYIDGKGGSGQYTLSAFTITGIAKGQHELALRLHKNDGSDAPWEPTVVDTVTFQMN